MRPRLLVLVAMVASSLCGVGAARADAATLYGGGTVPPTTTEPVPLFLVSVDGGRARVLGFSGGNCSNGSVGFGRFLSRPGRLRKGGRFRTSGVFSYNVAGGVARGSYKVRGTVRAGRGVATGVASVRVRFPSNTGKSVSCRGLNRRFRARNPGKGTGGRLRGPFYGVTAQGLPILVRPSSDSSTLAPVEMWTTLNCTALGPSQPVQRLTVPTTGPGTYAKTGTTTGGFVPALGSPVSIPAGTYSYTTFDFQAQIVNGQVTGTATLSSKIGNAQKQLIDNCSAPPITFVAVP